ncbi:hypothetical protein OZ411_42165, partial [Bradyrhizobium sp. Arg237L]|nr:hypothetical protein [Bradyrhizobium sp. Arg237L]
ASRLHTNFFQPSFKLKDKRREGAKVIKRYHGPATPYARGLAHPKLSKGVKRRLRELYRTLDPVALLAEMRDAQAELGARVGARAGKLAAAASPPARQRTRQRSRRGSAMRCIWGSSASSIGACASHTKSA